MHNALRAVVVAVLAAGALAACGGGGATTRNEVTTVSQGQELLDLKKAYDSGVLTKEEYERARARILDR